MQIEEAKMELQDFMADKVEELFPKGEAKERSQAIMLNAFACVKFIELMDKVFEDK